jgi:hypothetical protein
LELLPPIAIVVGLFAAGFIVNRWWLAVAASVAVGIWIGETAHLDVSSAFVGTVLGLLAGLLVLAGVGLRHLLSRLKRQEPAPPTES